ncbi:hypothetical protein B0A55_11244 [Friedmanniomyces simplex]|uniref:Complex 1 LYR protein domain-containing protein n=1 Tax=Friedmanniomyces simplex TaxID=329884 RepID=A0A4U0WGS4_9PEZI|nr:hypothetical protein B0A55_11244 [Friedmanniomyces simplex]
MPPYHTPRTSTPHRLAALALFRALLLASRTLPPASISPPQRNDLQNLIRNRFKQARHEQSTRRLRLAFEAGYEGIDLLDAAVAGKGGSQGYILELLARAPARVKQAPPLTTLDLEIVKELKWNLRVRPEEASSQTASSPSPFSSPPQSPHPNTTPTTTNTAKTSPFARRPLPLSELTGGKRLIPVLYNAQGIPVLRFSKPQPAALSGYINHRVEVKQKRHDTRHRLAEELVVAGWEDEWEGILSRYMGEREGVDEGVGEWGRDQDGIGEGEGIGGRRVGSAERERGWVYEVLRAREEVEEKLNEEGRRNGVMAGKMQGLVDREREMAARERREGERESMGSE